MMAILYKNSFSGGTIKSSFEEEWVYEPDGTVTLVEDPGKNHLVYKWDGQYFT